MSHALLILDGGRVIIPRERVLGYRFGRLTAIAPALPKHGKRYVVCVCDCGIEKTVQAGNLLQGKSLSCGCLQREASRLAHFKHGDAGRARAKASEWVIWCQMRQRCTNPRNPNWKNYGGRGIRVCADWLASYKAFREHIGPRPGPEYSIDRIDVNGNYEPGNVRWADPVTQRANQRCTCGGVSWRN